jgi:DNA sulfur modification protein DndD
MIINKLIVNNFRVFSGRHEIELTPKLVDGNQRPIVLFGGLNGAGKTTTLMAIRLAFYGRRSLGRNVSQGEYLKVLEKSVHRPKNISLRARFAEVGVEFTYPKFGQQFRFFVKRSWEISGSKVIEVLEIEQDGKILDELSKEQAQGFLNDLIPIGISDLFFFDGEKIGELADDIGGATLGNSIKKLIGLDVLETTREDLNSLRRNLAKSSMSDKDAHTVELLENELKLCEKQTQEIKLQISELDTQKAHLKTVIDGKNYELSAAGGAWAESREEEIRKETKSIVDKDTAERELQSLIAGDFPMALAKSFVDDALRHFENSLHFQQSVWVGKVVSDKKAELSMLLEKSIGSDAHDEFSKAFDHVFKRALSDAEQSHEKKSVSESSVAKLKMEISWARSNGKEKARSLVSAVNALNKLIDSAGKNIARAPLDDTLKPIKSKLDDLHAEFAQVEFKMAERKEVLRAALRKALESARALTKATDNLLDDNKQSRALELAKNASDMIGSFAEESTSRKIKGIEKRFVESFQRLSRKGDWALNARIDPSTFSVALVDENEREIDKNELSAGEKQIYAIAMLDALAKFSNSGLPVIIDTPLGRLDTVHREKILKNYFPHASEQVIILSTDTEIHEEYLDLIRPYVSHTIGLSYCDETKATKVTDKYFWNEAVA